MPPTARLELISTRLRERMRPRHAPTLPATFVLVYVTQGSVPRSSQEWSETLTRSPQRRRIVRLRQEIVDDPPANVSQAKVASHVPVGQLLVIKSEQMQNSRLEVMDMHRILDHVKT